MALNDLSPLVVSIAAHYGLSVEPLGPVFAVPLMFPNPASGGDFFISGQVQFTDADKFGFTGRVVPASNFFASPTNNVEARMHQYRDLYLKNPGSALA